MRVTGLPIAAYLGALVALALTSAFVAVLAIVLWLPPRPPDVMRADDVAEHFQAGYDYARVEGRALPGDSMAWSIQREAPEFEHETPSMERARTQLASQLDLSPDRVQLAADKIVSNDVFVFRVQDVQELRREALEGLREALREAEEDRRDAERNADEAEAAIREAEEAVREAHRVSTEAREEALRRREEARQEAIEAAAEARAIQEHAREIERRVRAETERITVITSTRTESDVAVDVRAGEHPRVMVAPPTPPVAPTPRAPEVGRTAPVAPTPPAADWAPQPRVNVVVPDVPAIPPVFAPAPAGVMLMSGFTVAAELPDGRWLVMRQGRNWEEIDWIVRAVGIIGGTLLLLSFLALLFARRLTRPIRAFSEAVQAVGVNPQSEPVREEGPAELRGAARAVNTMQARLRALIADRTKTLAAVAHDMRTPLMRLRLAAEHAPPEQRERMAKEIAEVEALVASFIAFARDDPAEEARVRLDLAALLQSIADDHTEAGRNVVFKGDERVIVTGQSVGLRRLFANLIENALKYGGCARIELRREGGGVVVDIEDDGPGVPSHQRESVFEPFVRLNGDENKSGAGLGLPAARSIARAHGGDVVILDAPKGALVRVTLPG